MTWGREHVQPVRYQGMDVGPFDMVVSVLDGETPVEAYRRAMAHLDAIAEEEYASKLPRFMQRCRDIETNL